MKRLTLIFSFVLGLSLGCANDQGVHFDDPGEYFRGAGAYFCCDAAGSCFYTSDGECEPGELLGWCPVTDQLPSGEIICKDWG